MAKPFMSCLKKRDLIQEVTTARETLIKFGREYLNQGRWLEALEFFERAPDPEGLQTLKKRGLEEGDPFLFKQACRFLKENPDPAEWKLIGETALSQGRWHQALTAFKALADETKIQEIEQLIADSKKNDHE
jgi:tetratricopeptide (TPR) repeat protein